MAESVLPRKTLSRPPPKRLDRPSSAPVASSRGRQGQSASVHFVVLIVQFRLHLSGPERTPM